MNDRGFGVALGASDFFQVPYRHGVFYLRPSVTMSTPALMFFFSLSGIDEHVFVFPIFADKFLLVCVE